MCSDVSGACCFRGVSFVVCGDMALVTVPKTGTDKHHRIPSDIKSVRSPRK